MRTNKSFVSLAVLSLALSGCMGLQARLHPLPEIPDEPSREWVEMNLPEFKRIAEQYPTEENQAALNRLEMYAAYYKELTLRASRVDRSLSLAWINTGRAGAAMRQPAYVHSLGGDFNTETRNGAALDPRRGIVYDPTRVRTPAVPMVPLVHPQTFAARPDRARGYSIYETSRWVRYCDNGKGMDEADWQFVTDEGQQLGIPDYLTGRCRAPTYDYNSYLAAWRGFCSRSDLSAPTRAIVKSSVRPKSIGGCAALNIH